MYGRNLSTVFKHVQNVELIKNFVDLLSTCNNTIEYIQYHFKIKLEDATK